MDDVASIGINITVNIIDMDNNKINIEVIDNFELSLYKIYKDNTFVFIDNDLYNLLTPTAKSIMGVLEIDDDLTPEEMLSKNVMFILTDKDFDKEEFLHMANTIKGSIVKYITISDIVIK